MKWFSDIMNTAVLSKQTACFNVGDDWGQGRTIFGGMQGAMAVKAMRHVLGHDAPLRSLQVIFIRPVSIGEVTATAKILRQGNSATQVQAELHNSDAIRLTAIGIFGLDRASEVDDLPSAPPCRRSREEATPLPYMPDVMPNFLQHFETRVGEGIRPFSGAGHPHGKTYTRHCDPKLLTEAHMVAMGDVAPPVALASLTRFAPASSMSWQLELVQQPEALSGNKWFRVDSEALAGRNGYTWQNTNYWDEQGKLVMLSRQCIAIFG